MYGAISLQPPHAFRRVAPGIMWHNPVKTYFTMQHDATLVAIPWWAQGAIIGALPVSLFFGILPSAVVTCVTWVGMLCLVFFLYTTMGTLQLLYNSDKAKTARQMPWSYAKVQLLASAAYTYSKSLFGLASLLLGANGLFGSKRKTTMTSTSATRGGTPAAATNTTAAPATAAPAATTTTTTTTDHHHRSSSAPRTIRRKHRR